MSRPPTASGPHTSGKWWVWILIALAVAMAGYRFWDKYQIAKSLAAGVAAAILGLLGDLFYSGFAGPDDTLKNL